MRTGLAQLRRLANLYSIKISYLDVHRRVRPASRESLLAALRALGAPVINLQDVPGAIRAKNLQYWQQPLDPVLVAWEDETPVLNLRLGSTKVEKPVTAILTLETGQEKNL